MPGSRGAAETVVESEPDMETVSADARLIIAASEANANLFYATRFLAPDPFVFLWHGREKILLMSDLELDRARSQAAVDAVLPIREYETRAKRSGAERPSLLDALSELLKERGIKSVLVPGSFPIEHGDGLRERGLQVQVKLEPFFAGRPVKSPAEVQAISDALRRTEKALDAAIAAIREAEVRDGVLWWRGAVLTSEVVKRLIARDLLEDGLIATHTIVACGADGCDPHNEGSGPLCAGQPIILDIFPRDATTQYFADITRTVVRGQASEVVQRMSRAVTAAQECAFGLIRDGAEGDAIHRGVQETMEGHGFQTGEVNGRMQGFFHGTGHGLGLEVHELPRVSRVKATLRTGNVVTVEPGLYYPGVGGLRIEDVVVVTDTGCRNLTTYPKVLEV
ncbi:MAG TPA: Xaa-Pro peptidase family protein [Candidatus Methylomirabilis sp.]|nr:Xaa-Pro peptidase family protein [Candidatus Methylomirabilis sp.]